MDMLKKGALTVVAATAVTSMLILLSGNGVAKNPAADGLGNESIGSNLVPVSNDRSKESILGLNTNINIAPPPGPFFGGSIINLGDMQGNERKSERVVIQKPPTLPAMSLPKTNITAKVPAMDLKKPLLPKQRLAPIVELVPPKGSPAPEFNIKELNEPFAPLAPSFSSVLGKADPVAPDKPKSLVPDLVKPSLVQPLKINEGSSPIWAPQPDNVRSKSQGAQKHYRYVPMPIVPSNQYQQKPVYEANPYFDKAPNNLLSSDRANLKQPNNITINNLSSGESKEGDNK